MVTVLHLRFPLKLHKTYMQHDNKTNNSQIVYIFNIESPLLRHTFGGWKTVFQLRQSAFQALHTSMVQPSEIPMNDKHNTRRKSPIMYLAFITSGERCLVQVYSSCGNIYCYLLVYKYCCFTSLLGFKRTIN